MRNQIHQKASGKQNPLTHFQTVTKKTHMSILPILNKNKIIKYCP